MKLSTLCQLNGGCMGCCGHDFGTKEQIKTAIKENTAEFNKLKLKTTEQFLAFRDRTHPMDLHYGVCRNLIEKDGNIFCPLHPTLHQTDLRKNHCDINHLCQTCKEFAKWDEKTQKKFLSFLKQKKIDNIDYSLLMDNGLLLEEFSKLL